MRRRLTASLLLFAPVILAAAPSRDWTDRQGRTLTAELISVDLDSVLLRVGPRYHRLGLSTLSAADQAVANEWKKANPRAPKPANLPAIDNTDPFALAITPNKENSTVVTPPGKTPTPSPKPTPAPTAAPKPSPTPTPSPTKASDTPKPDGETPGGNIGITGGARPQPTPTPRPPQPSPTPVPTLKPTPTPAPAPAWPQTPVYQAGKWNLDLLVSAGLKEGSIAFWDASGHLEHHDSARSTETTRRVIPRGNKTDRILPHPDGFLLNSEGGRLLQVRFDAPTRILADHAWLAEALPDGISWQTAAQSSQLILSGPAGKSSEITFKAGSVRDPRRLTDGFAFLERSGAVGSWRLARIGAKGETVSVPNLLADRLDSPPGQAGPLLLWRDEPASWQLFSLTENKASAPVPAASFLPAGWSLEAAPTFAGSSRAVFFTARRTAPPAARANLLATLDADGRPVLFLPLILPAGATACVTIK